jgi:hypothetical protein
MKRSGLLLTAIAFMFQGIFAQNVDDALRYSQIFYGGTARFMSMGGAFTAIGGDISSLSQNPAGLGVFKSSELTITPQMFNIKTTARFNGISTDNFSNFNLSQAGIVSNIISNNNETGLVTLNIGYSFNKTNNLSQSILIKGINNTSSMTDYWAGVSNGYYKDELKNNISDAYIANRVWIIDTLPGSNTAYGTVFSNYGENPPSRYGQTVRRLVTNDGYTGEHAISVGGNYSNKIFFGATLGISTIRYSSQYEHLESTNVELASQFQNFTYTDYYEHKGTGYSLKLGAIFRPVNALRIGLAFHSPTWYKIDEYYNNNIRANYTNGDWYEASNNPMRFNYALATPYRVLAGVALQLKKFAILSADYEFVDYSSARFSQTGDETNFADKNMEIRNSLKATSNIRLGGELRLNKLYLRTGYGYYGKAFKSSEDNAGLDYNLISFGTGFRERNLSLDFAFTSYKYSQRYFMYPVEANINAAEANLSTIRNMFTLTFGYKFGI